MIKAKYHEILVEQSQIFDFLFIILFEIYHLDSTKCSHIKPPNIKYKFRILKQIHTKSRNI